MHEVATNNLWQERLHDQEGLQECVPGGPVPPQPVTSC